MNCETCQFELEDFLYGELDVARRTGVAEHLSVCADCRALQATLERENEWFAQYYEQNALEPSEEMWQAIHARIQADAPQTNHATSGWTAQWRTWFAPLLAPALLRQVGFATLLVMVSVGLTALYFSTRNGENKVALEVKSTPSPTPTPNATAAPKQVTPAPNVPAPKLQESVRPQVASLKPQKTDSKQAAPQKLTEDEALAQQIVKATREYQGAIRLLERTIAKRKSALDEGTIQQFEGSLALIDASIASSREALRAHPNDPTAARFLLAAYSKKVELMQEIAMR
ncbi:MAG TPA: hypothetical protein VFZ34_13435 [Blastocatellia bacterium]|nr:hypothetical protein [Blastocatellia bacterium]